MKGASLTGLVLGFVIIVCLSLVLMDGWRSWTARKSQLQEAEVSTANMARAIAQHADDTIKAADTALLEGWPGSWKFSPKNNLTH